MQLVPRFTEGLKTGMTAVGTPPAPAFFSNLEEGLIVVDTNSPAITSIVKGREIPGTIIDGGAGMHVISLRTCNTLGIQDWEPCPFWLRMADTSSVQPTGLICDLEVTIGGHTFHISALVLPLQAQGAYPLLLGRPWLKTSHIKQNWRKNIITFQRGKAKVRVPIQPHLIAGKELTPLYAEGIHMLDGLADEEVDQYLQENPKIVPLFKIDVAEAVSPYILQPEENDEDPDKEVIRELQQAQKAL